MTETPPGAGPSRKVALDTETTGLEPAEGHRVIEVGCVELRENVPTGRTWHTFLDPEREVPEAAREVHGLSTEFLRDKPRFAEIADEFLGFLEDSQLVIHNAAFDLGFLNHELLRARRPPIETARAIDTLRIARAKRPNAPASLDALCRAFGIDRSARKERHGALIDAHLLAQVYLELEGGRQQRLSLAPRQTEGPQAVAREIRPPRPHGPSPEEAAAHEELVARLPKAAWRS